MYRKILPKFHPQIKHKDAKFYFFFPTVEGESEPYNCKEYEEKMMESTDTKKLNLHGNRKEYLSQNGKFIMFVEIIIQK